MLVRNIGALSTFWPDTRLLPFHILAFVRIYSLGSGTWALKKWLRNHQPGDLKTHKIEMADSWLGLMMAGASQVLANPHFGIIEGFAPVLLGDGDRAQRRAFCGGQRVALWQTAETSAGQTIQRG